MHGEDIDQARGFQNLAHRLPRSGQGQVTAVSPSPLPHSQQHRQTAVADAVQTRQSTMTDGPQAATAVIR
jgi:hypothetical protein